MIDIEITNQIVSSLEDNIDTMGLQMEFWTDDNDPTAIFVEPKGDGNMVEVEITNFEFTDDDDDNYAISLNATINNRGNGKSVKVESLNECGLAFAIAAAI